jgi:hypothetical protein
VQLRGPYALWVRTPTLTDVSGADETCTLIGDHVRGRPPCWPFGETAGPLVRRKLGRVLAYPRAAVQDLPAVP